MLTQALLLAARYAPVWSCHEVILDSEAIMVDKFAKIDLSCDCEIEERVRLHARLKCLSVLVIAIHVFVFKLVGIVLLVGLVFKLGIVTTHIVDVCKCACSRVLLLLYHLKFKFRY